MILSFGHFIGPTRPTIGSKPPRVSHQGLLEIPDGRADSSNRSYVLWVLGVDIDTFRLERCFGRPSELCALIGR